MFIVEFTTLVWLLGKKNTSGKVSPYLAASISQNSMGSSRRVQLGAREWGNSESKYIINDNVLIVVNHSG